jgi:hypothetical protein
MIGRGFKSVGWVAAVGTAALCCYMLSLQVATERADLARVERQIISTKQQIRSLQTELGTRGRLTQLEQWNEDVLALAAPASGQFLKDEFTLARLETHDATVADAPKVRMAGMETGRINPAAPVPAIGSSNAPAPTIRPELVHRASFTPPPSGPPSRIAPVSPTAAQLVPARNLNGKAAATPAKPMTAANSVSARPAAPRTDSGKVEARDAIRPAGSTRPTARGAIARADQAPTPPTRSTSRRSDRGSPAGEEAGKPARAAEDRISTERANARAPSIGQTAGKK